jgi:hypothetical protein
MVYCALGASIAGVVGVAVVARADSHGKPPTAAQSAFAEEAHDLLKNELVAALFQEFAETTPANVEQGKLAISLVFNDDNSNMRLVGDVGPLSDNDLPRDSFETYALDQAKQGIPFADVQLAQGHWYYRSSTPLNTSFSPSCVMCHTNFSNPSQWVGALMLKVPINP